MALTAVIATAGLLLMTVFALFNANSPLRLGINHLFCCCTGKGRPTDPEGPQPDSPAASAAPCQVEPTTPVTEALKSPEAMALNLTPSSRITLVTNGTVFTDDYTPLPDVKALVHHMAIHHRLFLVTRCDTDDQEETARQAIETLVSDLPAGRFRPEQSLYASTDIGIHSISRQLEAVLHIDATVTTANYLARFLPYVYLVGGSKKSAGDNTRVVDTLQTLVHKYM
ncbi:hypothetical protein KIPB_011940 [Kipferlia bialata]|uniref:Uncharacterized protein n=1 Tax=Kipferlia bialata TaxID=797122 RepID=A0A9K3D8S4_9EUKA|nr:hypothetical protein KIPB_011940 [Kipferlia bialata]|eukprot:g11940.t1